MKIEWPLVGRGRNLEFVVGEKSFRIAAEQGDGAFVQPGPRYAMVPIDLVGADSGKPGRIEATLVAESAQPIDVGA